MIILECFRRPMAGKFDGDFDVWQRMAADIEDASEKSVGQTAAEHERHSFFCLCRIELISHRIVFSPADACFDPRRSVFFVVINRVDEKLFWIDVVKTE